MFLITGGSSSLADFYSGDCTRTSELSLVPLDSLRHVAAGGLFKSERALQEEHASIGVSVIIFKLSDLIVANSPFVRQFDQADKDKVLERRQDDRREQSYAQQLIEVGRTLFDEQRQQTYREEAARARMAVVNVKLEAAVLRSDTN